MNETILVVDDNADLRELLCQHVLEPLGYRTLCAYDGQHGLEMALKHNPDLILLDVNMPRMSGPKMLRALHREMFYCPVIFITADADLVIAVDALRMGVKDYILKPFSPEEVERAVERALKQTRLEKEKAQLMREIVIADTVRQTSATFAHHINNLLMSLGGNLYLLQELSRKHRYPQEITQLIDSSLDSARRIARILHTFQRATQAVPTPYHGKNKILAIECQPAVESEQC